MGAKPLPAEIKQKRGTLRPSREPSGAAAVVNPPGDFPRPPESLLEPGRELWGAVLLAAREWVSYETDVFLLRIVCEQLDEREQLRELVIANPEQPRLRIGLRELDKAITSGLSSLGLTPTDRARLGVKPPGPPSALDTLTIKHFGLPFQEWVKAGSPGW
jgi:hypothetical protein